MSVWLDALVASVDQLFAEVSALAHQLRKADFRAQQEDGLLSATRNVLQLLADEGPRTVPWIAARQNASRQNLQIIANRLVSEALAEFRTNPAHKKSDLVQITPKGLQLLAASKERQRAALESISSSLNQAELAAAVSVLRQLREDLLAKKGNPARASTRIARARALPRQTRAEPLPAAVNAIRPENIEEIGLPVNLL